MKRSALYTVLGVCLALGMAFGFGQGDVSAARTASVAKPKAVAAGKTTAKRKAASKPAAVPTAAKAPAALPAAPIVPALADTADAAPGPTLVIPETADEKAKDRAFSAILGKAAHKDDFVGLAVAVVRHGQVTLLSTYGVRQAGKPGKVTPDTLFRLASLSKGFAASLAALSVEAGHMSWDELVMKRVPQFHLVTPQETAAVTVADILSHRTGLPPNAYDKMLEAGVAPGDILGRYQNVPLICPVGSCYAYQNVAFNMIASMLETVEGRPFEDQVETRLFQPLHMRTASYGRAALVGSDNWAAPHVRYRENPWRATPVGEAYYSIPAAGGVNASIDDLARWLVAQMGDAPQVLPADVVKELHAPLVKTPAETRRWREIRGRVRATYYGLGWRIYDYAGHTVISHAGGLTGYMSQVAFLPESDTGIAILANSRAMRTGRILPTFLDMELGLENRDWLALKTAADPKP